MNEINVQYGLNEDTRTGEMVGTASVDFGGGRHVVLVGRVSLAAAAAIAHRLGIRELPQLVAVSREVAAEKALGDAVAAANALVSSKRAASVSGGGAVVGTGWWFTPAERGEPGDRFRANTDDAKAMQRYMREYAAGNTAYLDHEEPPGVQARLNKLAPKILSDARFAALQWSMLKKSNRAWIRNKYEPTGFKGFVKDVGKVASKIVPVALDIATHGPIVGQLLQVAPGLRGTVDKLEKTLPVPGMAQLHGLGEQARALVHGEHAAKVVKQLIKEAPALATAASHLTAAKAGDPKALQYVRTIATAAKAGNVQGKQALALLRTLNAPLSKLARPGAVLPHQVSAAVKKSSAPAWLSARPMLQGGDPGKPATWPKWMRDNYNTALKHRDPAVLGAASSMRPYAFLNRYGTAVASGDPMHTPGCSQQATQIAQRYVAEMCNNPNAASEMAALVRAAGSGNAAARGALAAINAVLRAPQGGAVAGATFKTAFTPPFADAASMSLHNYYQIGGTELDIDSFYVGCAAASGSCVPDHTVGFEVPRRRREPLDLVIGAGGVPLTRRWDGGRWVWAHSA